jgi:hypothetical protein
MTAGPPEPAHVRRDHPETLAPVISAPPGETYASSVADVAGVVNVAAGYSGDSGDNGNTVTGGQMKHILRAAAAALLLATGLGYLGAWPAAADTVTGTKVITTYNGTIRLVRMKPILCLDDRDNSGRNGAIVQVWTCNGGAAQMWQVMSDGTIRHGGLCLDATGYGTSNGTKIQLWACTGNTNQKWNTLNYRVNYANPATHNLVLTDPGNGGNGTQQVLWGNESKNNQFWATR